MQISARPIRVRELVGCEHETCDGAAHRNVVAGVSDEIEIHIAA
jgi:hypothetical protein